MIGRPRLQRRDVPECDGDWSPLCHPVLRRIYAARGIVRSAQIEHRLSGLLAPNQLGGIAQACALIEAALRRSALILVVGDFDADGATGTAVAVRGLRMLGATRVDFGVPNRFTHGYGLSAALVDELVVQHPSLGAGGLLVTVDNGVAAHAGVLAARAHGMQVIVTDHHLSGVTLPQADAMVNPNLEGDAFPSKSLAGVGVMFYLLLALRAHLRATDWFAQNSLADPDLSSLLDLVALGTVADLVALDQNNRILVEAGLKRIRAGRVCAGITALLQSGKRDPTRLVASDLGYVVAPRINAAGRLEDIRLGIECLITDDATQAQRMADRLSSINDERRELQTEMVEQAEASVQKWILRHSAAALPVGIVLFEPDWHHGVVGLVASKLKETFNRPVIACAPAGVGSDEVKASGRSIAGFHLRDALAEVDARIPGLLQRFGGHAMAAGLTLHRSGVEQLAKSFDAIARERIEADRLDAVLLTDGELGAGDFCMELAQQLRYAGPWGQAFPEPVFDGEFEIRSWRVLGEKHLRLKLRHRGLSEDLDAMHFNAYFGTPPPVRVRLAFQLDVNEWNGRETLRLTVRHLEPI